MSGIKFELKPVDEKPVRRSRTVERRRSKYDPLIDKFMSEEHDLVRVDVENRKAHYLRARARVNTRGKSHRCGTDRCSLSYRNAVHHQSHSQAMEVQV